MTQILKKISLFALVLGVSYIGAVAGQGITRQVLFLSAYGASVKGENPDSRYENLELFQKVMHFIESHYVEKIDNDQLIQGAIKGMMGTLDPHSNFLPPDVFKDMKTDTSGKFGGIGIEIGMKDNVLTIISPIEDTPAWTAGLKANDKIVKIDGLSTKGMNLMEAVSKMRGKKGTAVKLSIWRDGFEKVRDVDVTREIIKIRAVKHVVLEPHYGYVRLASFNENAADDVQKAIKKIENAGGNLHGLVFDLRNNPGGLLDQAVEVSSLFMDEGAVVSTIGRNKDQKEVKHAIKGKARKDFPVAVLVNSASASAAEIVAGALQDHRRAIIMGQPTFGKGSVQSVIDLEKGMGLKLTIARYYTPGGRSIQEKGVKPDIILDDFDPKLLAEARLKTKYVREKDLHGHFKNEEKDYTPEELEALSRGSEQTSSGGSESKPANETLAADDFSPSKFDPKSDFQVQEALNYLKSYELFKKIADTHLGPVDKDRQAAADQQEKGSSKKE